MLHPEVKSPSSHSTESLSTQQERPSGGCTGQPFQVSCIDVLMYWCIIKHCTIASLSCCASRPLFLATLDTNVLGHCNLLAQLCAYLHQRAWPMEVSFIPAS